MTSNSNRPSPPPRRAAERHQAWPKPPLATIRPAARTLDTSFGNTAGELVVNYAGAELPSTLAIGADGKIYVGGSHSVYGADLDGDGGAEFFAIRLNTDGSIDRSFGYNGISKGDANHIVYANGMAVDPTDGSVIIVGETYTRSGGVDAFAGTRLGVNGMASDTFAIAGDITASGYDVTIQPDGRFVVAGTDGDVPLVERFNRDGTIDATWHAPMFAPSDFPQGIAYGITRAAGGSFIVVGRRILAGGGGEQAFITHLATDGTRQETLFRPGQSATLLNEYADVATAPDGSVFAVGQDYYKMFLSKFDLT